MTAGRLQLKQYTPKSLLKNEKFLLNDHIYFYVRWFKNPGLVYFLWILQGSSHKININNHSISKKLYINYSITIEVKKQIRDIFCDFLNNTFSFLINNTF